MPPRQTGPTDMFDDYEPEPAQTANRATPSPVKKTKEEREEARQAKARSTRSKIGGATRKRAAWEASPGGQERSRDIQDLVTTHHNNLLRARGMPEINRTQMKRAQIYHALGVTNEGHGLGDQQLPGFENPHAVATPPRWEDLSDKDRANTEAKLRQHGTSMGQMQEDYGRQMDQSVWRAHMAGHNRASTGEPVPFTKHFYDEHPADAPEPLDRPKEMMRESRSHLAGQGINIDPSVHVGAISHVSPNTKFTSGEPGRRTSPNIEAAESVIKQHAEGVPPTQMTSGVNRQGVTNTSRPANAVRTGRMLQHTDRGNPMGTSRNAPSKSAPLGSSQWGPKTGPFANSFDESEPDFFVADVHSGGGGMFPHLSSEKPYRRKVGGGGLARKQEFRDDPRSDRELNKRYGIQNVGYRDKSEREKAMGSTPNFHSAADYAARQAGMERGQGTSVRQPQAMQWGEEQLQRKAATPRLDIPSHEQAYPSRPIPHVNEGQFKMF
jgi:hypothetical protein